MKSVFLSYGQHCINNWKWEVEPGYHEGYTLWSIWGGSGRIMLGDTIYDLSYGDIFFINYTKRVSAYQDEQNPINVRFIDFIMEDPEEASDWPEYRHFTHTLFMEEVFNRVQIAQQQDDSLQQKIWSQAAIVEYKNIVSPNNNKYSEQIHLLCRMFQDHPDQKYDVRQFAADFALNYDYFIRIFKNEQGVTPYAYLQNIRLERAKTLLRNSSFSITEISKACGFSNLYDFSHFFSKKMGMSPMEFRK